MAKKALTFFEAKEYFSIPTSNGFNALAEFMDQPKPGENGPQDYASMTKRNRISNNGPSREIRNKKQEDNKIVREPEREEDARKRKRKEPSNESYGTALNNPHRVDEHEQWTMKLHDAKNQQGTLSKATINHAIQEALQRYYSDIIADTNLKGQARENIIETSKKYLSFDVIH